MFNKTSFIITSVTSLIVAGVGYGLYQHYSERATDQNVVTVGLVGATDTGMWDEVAKTAKDEYGITVKTKIFSDYNQPNMATMNGDIDINAFQHNFFLDNWNEANNDALRSIGDTFISPIRLYSNDYQKMTQFKRGDTIVIPNDPTNEGRALLLLENAGMIKLQPKKLPTVKDIKANPRQLKFREVAADQTATSLKANNVAGAIINGNYAIDAKINPKTAVYVEKLDKRSTPWVNIIVAPKEQTDNPTYRKVVKAFQTEQTKRYMKEHWGDNQIAAWDLNLK